MASNRHLGRIVALQTLYEFDFRMECSDDSVDINEIMDRNVERYSETIEDKGFIKDLVLGVQQGIDSLDGIIAPVAPEWPIEQIARIDRNILRMAVWELHNADDVPPKVVINEAVELAKAFGSDNSSKFVNGVLGTVYRNIEEESSKAKKPVKKPAKSKNSATKSGKNSDNKSAKNNKNKE